MAVVTRVRGALRALAPLLPLLHLPRAHAARLAGALALGLLQSAAALGLPWLVGGLAAALFASGAGAPGAAQLATVFVLAAVHAGLGFAAQDAVGRVESALAADLRHRVYTRVQALPLHRVRARPAGELLELLAWDVEAAATFAARTPVALPPIALTLAGALACMLLVHPALALLFAAALPPLWWAVRRAGRPVDRLSRELAETHGELLALLQENLSHLLTIRAFAREDAEAERHRRVGEALRARRDAQLRAILRVSPVTQLAASAACVGIAAFAVAGPGPLRLQPGELVRILLYGLVLCRGLGALADLHVQVREARVSARRLAGVLDEPAEAAREAPGDATPPLGGALELRGVRFRHPGREPALVGVDLRVEPGELVALVGPNGAGKSTLAHLLLRLHEPESGRILVGGRDLRDLPRAALRRQVALASQDTQIFQRSVRDNIAFARPEASDAEIREAARRAGADETVRALPEGYATLLGEDGHRLSGGQRQRIALARALLTDPRILILDEATCMLDADGESDFLRRNRDWLRRRIALLVTHRPASLRLVDRVIELRGGRAHERGRAAAGRASRTSEPRSPEPTPGSRPL